MLQVVDPDGNVTTCEYDASGRRTRMILTVDGVQVMDQAYNHSEDRTAGIRQNGRIWVLAKPHSSLYDAWNVIFEIVPDESAQTSTHDTWGSELSCFAGFFSLRSRPFEGSLSALSNSLQGAGGVGGLLAAKTPDGDWFYCYDGNGNVTTLVNTSGGSVVASYDYSPFGLTVAQSGPAAPSNVHRFSTKPLDESHLYYYGYRYYNPTLGRWMSRDRIAAEIKEYCFSTGIP